MKWRHCVYDKFKNNFLLLFFIEVYALLTSENKAAVIPILLFSLKLSNLISYKKPVSKLTLLQTHFFDICVRNNVANFCLSKNVYPCNFNRRFVRTVIGLLWRWTLAGCQPQDRGLQLSWMRNPGVEKSGSSAGRHHGQTAKRIFLW